jgi:hypothetical protein
MAIRTDQDALFHFFKNLANSIASNHSTEIPFFIPKMMELKRCCTPIVTTSLTLISEEPSNLILLADLNSSNRISEASLTTSS